MNTWSPMCKGKKATLWERRLSTKIQYQVSSFLRPAPYPLLNFLNGGLITLLLLMTQCLPTLTFARSPLMMQSFITMVWKAEHHVNSIIILRKVILHLNLLNSSWLTFPFRTMFWLPQSTDCLLTLFPDACMETGNIRTRQKQHQKTECQQST